eukprot:8829-Chlamydomonas_euryale.AAC.1
MEARTRVLGCGRRARSVRRHTIISLVVQKRPAIQAGQNDAKVWGHEHSPSPHPPTVQDTCACVEAARALASRQRVRLRRGSTCACVEAA